MSFEGEVYNLCRKIPKGRVTTYKILAEKLNTKAYRLVGKALSNNPYAPAVPCHRVVASSGKLLGFKGSTKAQALKAKQKLLEQEGIAVNNMKIKDFNKHLFCF